MLCSFHRIQLEFIPALSLSLCRSPLSSLSFPSASICLLIFTNFTLYSRTFPLPSPFPIIPSSTLLLLHFPLYLPAFVRASPKTKTSIENIAKILWLAVSLIASQTGTSIYSLYFLFLLVPALFLHSFILPPSFALFVSLFPSLSFRFIQSVRNSFIIFHFVFFFFSNSFSSGFVVIASAK